MIIVVITNNKFFQLAVFAQLTPYVFVKGVEMILQLRRVHAVLGVIGWVLVQVWHEDGLGVGWFDVFAGAAVTVAAGADFEVE